MGCAAETVPRLCIGCSCQSSHVLAATVGSMVEPMHSPRQGDRVTGFSGEHDSHISGFPHEVQTSSADGLRSIVRVFLGLQLRC